MSNIATRNQTWFMVEETTVDTEEAISSGAEAVAVLEGGEMVMNKENLERTVITTGLDKLKPLGGMSDFSGSVSIEAKANGTEGEAPEYEPMLKTIFGVRTTAEVTSKTGTPTTTEIPIENADIASFAVNDIVVVKESGAYHVSPISAVDSTVDASTITLKYAASGAFASGVAIAAYKNYQPVNTGHKTVSIFREESGDSDTLTDKIIGGRANSMTLTNFTTGQIPQFDFAFQGISGSRTLTDSGQTASFDAAQPPVVLSATVYVNGSALCFNDFGFTLENNVGQVTCVTQETGVLSQRIIDRVVTGTMNPYKQDDSLALYNLAQDRTTFDLFVSAHVPSSTSGEYEDVVSFYFPTCVITESGEADVNGIITEEFSFQAFSDAGATAMVLGYS